ncbi:hypothetical protein [Thermomonospora amylolytica]|uniref:hypothetical protein n=1 Tax=Thermomonospora amylolytica TaxID=1411117 RepID=UPI0013005AD9|nr:hypothetical protein [Thermomonospora amylolytica]
MQEANFEGFGMNFAITRDGPVHQMRLGSQDFLLIDHLDREGVTANWTSNLNPLDFIELATAEEKTFNPSQALLVMGDWIIEEPITSGDVRALLDRSTRISEQLPGGFNENCKFIRFDSTQQEETSITYQVFDINSTRTILIGVGATRNQSALALIMWLAPATATDYISSELTTNRGGNFPQSLIRLITHAEAEA